MRNLVILGGDGIGLIAADIAETIGSHKVIGFLNDTKEVGQSIGRFKRYPVLGKTSEVGTFLQDQSVDIYVAMVGMTNEEAVYNKIEQFKIPQDRRPTLIHPAAYFNSEMTRIGNGTLMAAYSQLSPDVELKENAILLGNSFVGHNSVVGEHSHIATNAVVGGYITVGKFCHIGSNCTIRERVKIGDFVLIGAGSVVISDCDRASIHAGNPARFLRASS
ncbi:acetyltransferase [Sulfitobacter sp.]|uniref:acetyltransferase n=1 Tax=Sulfitobacter sp. TaxID=1903071 RepID=UPI00261E2E20|nr:acetyltransferase [Sulfitobacter sp.]